MIPIARPMLGQEENDAVQRVLASGQLAQGKNVAEFERQFALLCEVKEAVAVSSGTSALYLALLAYKVGPGDEIITTPFSFAATANAILLTGATPVFVDIEPDSYQINPDLVEAAITPRTKALLPVHLYGNPCDMGRLMQIAEKHQLAIIEDACQAHAATIAGKPVGSFGTGCFSFYATKNMTAGEGGIVTTNDPEVAERVRLLRNQGQRERYVQIQLGQNYRMTDIQGAVALVQLKRLEWFTKRRIENADFLTQQLRGVIQTPVVRPGYRHVYHQYTIQVSKDREQWMMHLGARGIGTAIHYPIPIHQQPYYREHQDTFRCCGELSVAEHAAQHVLSLPIHPAVSAEDLKKISEEVLELCR